MPTVRISPNLEMQYLVDDYTDPWCNPEAILLLHGAGDSGAVWYGWVPHLARRFRIVRPDIRGFGASTPMPRDFPWTLDVIIDDLIRLMDALNIKRYHLVGAKIGGTIASAFAARHPERVLTLTVGATPPALRTYTEADVAAMIKEWEEHGFEVPLRRTMAGRLGPEFPPNGVEWLLKLMCRSPASSWIGFMATGTARADVSSDLPRIACPTLVIVPEVSTIASLEDTRAWQKKISNSKLLVLPTNSNHVAVSHADRCAQATLEFISHASTD
jgi:3-oxoadipate enol-lactonase